jgi:hypothetical protein
MAQPNRDMRSQNRPENLPPNRPQGPGQPVQSVRAAELGAPQQKRPAPPAPPAEIKVPSLPAPPGSEESRCKLGGPVKEVRHSEVESFVTVPEYGPGGSWRKDHHFEFDSITGKAGQEIRFIDDPGW